MDSSPSIQNLLISIPSRASSLAIACVGHLLEDQMSDPRQMASNLKQLGSTVSGWTMDKDAAGDAGFPCNLEKRNIGEIPLLNLPIKIRHTIWSYLDNKDVLNLRLVSSQLICEIDHRYGLPLVMDTSAESFEFMRRVTTRSCFVTRLDNLMYFNFLPHPLQLNFLRFREDVFLNAEQIDLIFRKFSNLKTCSVSSKNNLYHHFTCDGKLELVRPTSTNCIMNVLSGKGNLFGVHIRFNAVTNSLNWELEFGPKKQKLGCMQLSIPKDESYLQDDAMNFLEKQNQLFEVRSELVGIMWIRYVNVIKNNSATLTGLHLLSLKCNNNDPFNCNILKGCVNLRCFSLTGENSFSNMNPGAFSYIPITGVECLSDIKNLCILSFGKVYFTKEEFDVLNQNMTKKVWIRIIQSLVEKEEITEVKLGVNFSDLEDESMVDYEMQEASRFGKFEEFKMNNIKESKSHTGLKAFISETTQGYRSELIKGIIITAWIAIC